MVEIHMLKGASMNIGLVLTKEDFEDFKRWSLNDAPEEVKDELQYYFGQVPEDAVEYRGDYLTLVPLLDSKYIYMEFLLDANKNISNSDDGLTIAECIFDKVFEYKSHDILALPINSFEAIPYYLTGFDDDHEDIPRLYINSSIRVAGGDE